MTGPFAKTFKDLDVYKLAFVASLALHKYSLEFPKIEQYAIADQLRRSSKSVCANIAEGFGRQRRSKAEFKRFLLMAIGSSDEVQVWLQYCARLEYIPSDKIIEFDETYVRLSKMLQALYSSISDDR